MMIWSIRATTLLGVILISGCFEGPNMGDEASGDVDEVGVLEIEDASSPEPDVQFVPPTETVDDVKTTAEVADDAKTPPEDAEDTTTTPEDAADTTTLEDAADTKVPLEDAADTKIPLEDAADPLEDAADAPTPLELPGLKDVPSEDVSPIDDADYGPADTTVAPEDGSTDQELVLDGPCCDDNLTPACDDLACTAAVCAVDPFCCQYKWDALCVKKAVTHCALCDLSDAGDCCESNGTPKCEDYDCVQAVCEKDSFCCETTWDTFCAKCSAGLPGYQELDCSGVEDECDCEPPDPEQPTAFELAQHWSPVWYQDTDGQHYEADYIVAYDFDGDTISSNNWENLEGPSVNLGAIIYFAVVETHTHWYITYADFHPRDWAHDCDPFLPFTEPCHENDMEGVMVMVKKDGTPFGEFVLLMTEAHNTLHIFTNDPNITEGTNKHFEQGVEVTFEDGSHPEVYVESKGHGVCALYFDGPDHCKHDISETPPAFGGGDGIVYRYKGKSEIPTSGNDDDVGYSLRSIQYSIWLRRFDICNGNCTFDTEMMYDGTTLAKAFDGNTWGDDKANPPWAWDDPEDGPVYRGDFFFRPAKTVKTHVNIPGEVSQTYLVNPFLDSFE